MIGKAVTGPSAPARVLVVEDEPEMRDLLADNLEVEGYRVVAVGSAEEALQRFERQSFALILLDVMLPQASGFELCRTVRSRDARIPIIMLTARNDEADRVLGLDLGADDYVSKPFSIKVLLERIKALRRRRSAEATSDEITTKQGVSVDRRRHQALAEGKPLALTRSEFRLLDTLIRQPGRVFHRTELIDAALGEDTMVMERTIDVHIRALRRKLGAFADVIETVRGVGYRYRDTEPAVEPVA